MDQASILSCLSSVVAWMMEPTSSTSNYATLRSSFFTGFITLGSLMTAAMNYVVSTLKTGVYETSEYRAIFFDVKKAGGEGDINAPLKRLSASLFAVIVLSFITSFSQITIGLIPYNVASAFCMGLAIVTMSLVLFSLYVMWGNLKYWQMHLASPKPLDVPIANLQTRNPGRSLRLVLQKQTESPQSNQTGEPLTVEAPKSKKPPRKKT